MDNQNNQNQNQHNHGGTCQCGWCSGSWKGRKFSILRIVIALALLTFVYHAGMEVGEMKGELRAYGAPSGMMGGYNLR